MTNTNETIRVKFINDDDGSDDREIDAGETGVIADSEFTREHFTSRRHGAVNVRLDRDDRKVAAWVENMEMLPAVDDVHAGDTVTVQVTPRGDTDPWRNLDEGPGPFKITGEVWSDAGDNPHGPVLRVAAYWIGANNVALLDHTRRELDPLSVEAERDYLLNLVTGMDAKALGENAFEYTDEAGGGRSRRFRVVVTAV